MILYDIKVEYYYVIVELMYDMILKWNMIVID